MTLKQAESAIGADEGDEKVGGAKSGCKESDSSETADKQKRATNDMALYALDYL